MGLIMEYLVICIYVITGALTPLHKDKDQSPGYQAPDLGPFRTSADALIEMGKWHR